MASTINANNTTGLVSTADTSGILQLQTNGTTAVTVDDSQRVAFVAGTAALPAITTTGDTNTGIFFPAADTIAFSEGGVEAARIDSSGNLGLGITNPTKKLSITGSSNDPNSGAIQTTNANAGTANQVGLWASNGTQSAQFSLAGTGYTAYGAYASGNAIIYNDQAITLMADNATTGIIKFAAGGNTERARIDSSGNFMVGTTSTTFRLNVSNSAGSALFYSGAASQGVNGGENAANACIKSRSDSVTGRSINAAGTINASGADYAEYMTKTGSFTVAKGDVVGINAQGKLTNVFADAVSFVVKSTDPSYVGGDKWGDGFEDDAEGLEAARQTVDRIAFSGQVPVNVISATAGQYIVPVNDNGSIKGQAISNPTFEQYQSAVGKVIAIEADGRARIIVKVA